MTKEESDKLIAAVTQRPRPRATVDLDALIREYEDNEFAADAKYGVRSDDPCHRGLFGDDQCTPIQTSGEIEDFGRDQNGAAFLSLRLPRRAFPNPGSVSVDFLNRDSEAQLAKVRRGQRVTLWCVPLYARGVLKLTNCTFAADRS